MDYELFLALIERSHAQNRGSARTRTAIVDHGNLIAWHVTSATALVNRLVISSAGYLRVCIGATNGALSVRNLSHSSRRVSCSDCA